jgi:hypothetical protein
MRTAFWIAGGVSAGVGVLLTALHGFTFPGGDIATQVSRLGSDALPEVSITPIGYLAITMIIVGAILMIKANATAWKQTGGY